jgi:hypothetical protein
MDRVRCDHCGWAGDRSEQFAHPRLGDGVCPDCWLEGFETRPRDEMGPLMEALLDHEPSPRVPKAIIDWTEEEWAMHMRMEAAREAHERSDVRLKTTVEDASQLGFGFMREEFKVAPLKKRKDC